MMDYTGISQAIFLLQLESIASALSRKWPSLKGIPISSASYIQIGMPNQSTHGGTGAASCGVAVILAARDIMMNGFIRGIGFTWTYAEMRTLRQQLALKVLQWGATHH